MAWFHTSGVGIDCMAAAVPKNRNTVDSYIERYGEVTVEKFKKSTGIKSNHQTNENQTASDLGYAAAEHLLKEMNIDRQDVGILLFITLSPDYRKPATACILQMRLGLSMDCACMDAGHGCAGFVYGHQLMESMLSNCDSKYGLLILGETTSKLISEDDHSSMMFGDAGAAILYKKDKAESNHTLLKTDGSRFKDLVVPAGGFREMYTSHEQYLCSDGTKRSKYDLHMDGMDVFVFSTNDVPATMKEYLSDTKTVITDYDCVAFHQANCQILNLLTRKFRIDKEKVPICIDRYGNTSSVSIPLALCDYYGDKNIGEQRVLASGFGVGLAWGVTSFILDANRVLPIIETDDYYKDGILNLSKGESE